MIRHAAFITGAGKNIGRGIALEFARRGIDVVLNGRSDRAACQAVAAECAALGVETLIAMGDVGDRAVCRDLAAQALDRFGTIDVLVTSAAARPHAGFLDTSDEDWARVMDLNASQLFWLAKAFVPGMLERGWGRIIGFTGMHAIRGAHMAPTVAGKHAQWGLAKALSHEFAARGITANVLSPGPIGPADPNPAPDKPKFPKLIPMDRRGTPEEVAAVAGMLVSDEGGYVTGQMIAINGGGTT
ncbi:SDR family oxidoreductase [Rhodobacterales bacterium HKCCE2091]|nr:SDR family oxidoreductase [Rhodobacterales bacterium HKCCE2091]